MVVVTVAFTVFARVAPVAIVIAVVSLVILTFLGVLSETSLNIAYSTLMEEFSIGASVVQWLTTRRKWGKSNSMPAADWLAL